MKYILSLCTCCLLLVLTSAEVLQAADPFELEELRVVELTREDGASYISYNGGLTWIVSHIPAGAVKWPMAIAVVRTGTMHIVREDGTKLVSYNSGLNWHLDQSNPPLPTFGTNNSPTSERTRRITLAEPQSTIGLAVRPNPASGRVSVSYTITSKSNVQIELRNLYGSVVKRINKDRLASGKYRESMDLSALRPGVYHVHIQAGEQSQSAQFVVAR